MDTSIFDFDLPKSSIAQVPAAKRDQSRLMLVDRKSGKVSHHVFTELPDLLPESAALIRNNVSVLKARIYGKRETGGKVECLLLHPDTDGARWWCLLKPGKKLPIGASFDLPDGSQAHVVDKKPSGECLIEPAGKGLLEISESFGNMPLPPYIERKEGNNKEDDERYQTVYADPDQKQAAAAPTAGLHFTDAVLSDLKSKGIGSYDLTLRVGIDTFKPIQTEKIEDHAIHVEYYEIPPQTQELVCQPNGRSRVAVGTTSMRSIEHYMRQNPTPQKTPYSANANIFIYPPETFLAADHLITNFHFPRSTLLCLVSAFLTPGSTDGIKMLKDIYKEAIAMDYRFFSYGDAMLIL